MTSLKRIFPVIGVLLLVFTAGCSGINPLDQKSTPEKINTKMQSADTVQTQMHTLQNITIVGKNTSVTSYQKEISHAKYDFQTNKSVQIGQGQQYFLGANVSYKYETYYINGTVYTHRMTKQQGVENWTVRQTDDRLNRTYRAFTDPQFLQHYTPNKSVRNGSIVYQINLLENKDYVNAKFNRSDISPVDQYRPVLDTYVLEIYIDKKTYRLEEVRIFAYGNLTRSELGKVTDLYKNKSIESVRGKVVYAQQIKFTKYNQPVNITLPESARQAKSN